MNKTVRTFKIPFLGTIFLGVLVIVIPLIIEKVFWNDNNSINTTKYIFFSFLGFFLILLGILIPFWKRISNYLRLKKTNFWDGVATILIFLVSTIPLFILFSVAKFLMKKMDEYKYKIFHCNAAITPFLLGLKVRFHGFYDTKAPFGIFNHTSPLDYILAPLAMGIDPWNILVGQNLTEDKETTENKIVFWSLRSIIKRNAIFFDRKSEPSRRAAYRRMIQEIELEKKIAIFPEGGRLPKEKIKNEGIILSEFEDGVFALAWKRKLPIQPIVLDWPVTWRGKDDDWWGIHPSVVDIYYLDIIDPEDYESLEDFEMACWLAMKKQLENSKNVQNFLKGLQKKSKNN